MKLPYDYSRCFNTECPDKFLCARFTDRPLVDRLSWALFPTPKYAGECQHFILNTTDTDK